MSTENKLPPPTPMAGMGVPVDWMFAFKFNAATNLGTMDDVTTPALGEQGLFGGKAESYPEGHNQQYVFATSASPTLAKGPGFIGASLQDPLGATFAQVYDTLGYHYVLWSDQFYNNPLPNMESPWGHSKGMLAWNDDGEGLGLQVSTPSWPASGSFKYPRQNDGNTLGFINDDDVEVSQHFFAVRLSKDDVVAVLNALANASVATSTSAPSIVQNGGPADIQALVASLGKLSASKAILSATLSTGVQVISKPSGLNVPPWQMISGKLGGVPLRVASWWQDPQIYSTASGSVPQCWSPDLGKPGAVAIATTGNWQGIGFGLQGGDGDKFNHAKIGVSTDPTKPLCIFGDMNQQGAIEPNYSYQGQNCSSSQNGRGGTFYVVKNAALFASLTQLLAGSTAPTK